MQNNTLISLLVTVAVLMAAGVMHASDRPAATRPGEEMMRPMQYGIRATPAIARGLARVLVNDEYYPGLTDTQRDQMADKLGRRFMESAHTQGRQWLDLFNGIVEAEMTRGHRYDAETGVEFARRYLAVSDDMRRLINSTVEDWRDILTPDQLRLAEKSGQRLTREIDGIEKRMRRWEKGDIGEDRDPFATEPAPAKTEQERKQEELESRRLNAEEKTNRILEDLSAERWKSFIMLTAEFYGFTGEQKQQAEQIRVEQTDRVQQIMTDDWKAKLKRNRMRYSVLPIKKMAPYKFRLDEEFREMKEPIQRIADEFRDKVIGLATDKQRRDALAKVETAAKRHGIQPEEMKVVETLLLRSAATE